MPGFSRIANLERAAGVGRERARQVCRTSAALHADGPTVPSVASHDVGPSFVPDDWVRLALREVGAALTRDRDQRTSRSPAASIGGFVVLHGNTSISRERTLGKLELR